MSQINVGIPKPTEPTAEFCMAIREMRIAISRAYRDSQLVRQCRHRAEVEGLSSDEEMTVLAYHALRAFQDSFDREMAHVMLNPKPPFIACSPGSAEAKP